MIATLRLLRLLVKHGAALDDLFRAGVAHTPARPWRAIVPQLLARLGQAARPTLAGPAGRLRLLLVSQSVSQSVSFGFCLSVSFALSPCDTHR